MYRFYRAIPIGYQVFRMKVAFATFKYGRRHLYQHSTPTWIGTLQPTETSPLYQVRITYSPPKPPKVIIIDPPPRTDAPHRYADGSLCLYFPKDGSWTPYHFIADTIVPWTALWLYCYQLWCDTGKWFGPEAPHPRRKK